MYCIGIDVAKFKHSAAVIGEGGERLLEGLDFSNDVSGFEELATVLGNLGALPGRSAVCLEATGHYGRNLINYLEKAGYEVFEVNPLLTSNWRKAMSVRKVKNDKIDAEALALWLFAGNPARRYRRRREADDLRSLVRFRTYLSHVAGDCKRKTAALLDVLFPEYHRFFSSVFCKTSIAVLKVWPGSAPLAHADANAVADVMCEASGGKFGAAKADELVCLAKSSVGQNSEWLGFQMRQLLELIEFTESQIVVVDEQLARIVGDSLLMTIPGIGVVCAAGILGELGDISRFDSAAKIVAFAGCDPSVFESGEFEGAQAHISKRGSSYLRWYLWVAADRARRFDPVLRDYYLKKRAEGKCHKVAISAVVRKLSAIIFAVLRDGKPYTPKRLADDVHH